MRESFSMAVYASENQRNRLTDLASSRYSLSTTMKSFKEISIVFLRTHPCTFLLLKIPSCLCWSDPFTVISDIAVLIVLLFFVFITICRSELLTINSYYCLLKLPYIIFITHLLGQKSNYGNHETLSFLVACHRKPRMVLRSSAATARFRRT